MTGFLLAIAVLTGLTSTLVILVAWVIWSTFDVIRRTRAKRLNHQH
jgi:hypothetical protein